MISKYISHVWGSWQEVLGGGTVASRWPCVHSGGVSPSYSAVMAGSACWNGVESGACGKGQMWLDRGCGSADWDCYVAIGKCLALTCAFLCRRRSTKKKWITKCLRYILRMLGLTSSHPQAKSLALHCIWTAQTSTVKSRSFIFRDSQQKAASVGFELDPLTKLNPFGWDETRKQLVLAVLKNTKQKKMKKKQRSNRGEYCLCCSSFNMAGWYFKLV